MALFIATIDSVTGRGTHLFSDETRILFNGEGVYGLRVNDVTKSSFLYLINLYDDREGVVRVESQQSVSSVSSAINRDYVDKYVDLTKYADPSVESLTEAITLEAKNLCLGYNFSGGAILYVRSGPIIERITVEESIDDIVADAMSTTTTTTFPGGITISYAIVQTAQPTILRMVFDGNILNSSLASPNLPEDLLTVRLNGVYDLVLDGSTAWASANRVNVYLGSDPYEVQIGDVLTISYDHDAGGGMGWHGATDYVEDFTEVVVINNVTTTTTSTTSTSSTSTTSTSSTSTTSTSSTSTTSTTSTSSTSTSSTSTTTTGTTTTGTTTTSSTSTFTTSTSSTSSTSTSSSSTSSTTTTTSSTSTSTTSTTSTTTQAFEESQEWADFRLDVRSGALNLDEEITPTGFAGVEDTDWGNIWGKSLPLGDSPLTPWYGTYGNYPVGQLTAYLQFSEDTYPSGSADHLDLDSVPAAGDFSIGGFVGTPEIYGITFNETDNYTVLQIRFEDLGGDPSPITVSYTKGDNPLRDTNLLEIENFTDFSIILDN